MIDKCILAHSLIRTTFEDTSILMSKTDVRQGDLINLYINYESIVFNSIDVFFNYEDDFNVEDFVRTMISEALQTIAHYKRYFVSNYCNTNIFIYYTDMNSKNFPATTKITKDYRFNYTLEHHRVTEKNKYADVIRQLCNDTIVPTLEKIIRFIPNVYFITAKNYESSAIPKYISELFPGRKNIVIGRDIYDTQYMVEKDFYMIYIKHPPTKGERLRKAITVEDMLSIIFRYGTLSYPKGVLSNYTCFKMILASRGNHKRNISPVGNLTDKALRERLQRKNMNIDESKSVDYILDKVRDVGKFTINKMRDNYDLWDINYHYSFLKEDEKEAIKSSITDSFDYNSLIELSKKYLPTRPLSLRDLVSNAPMKTEG